MINTKQRKVHREKLKKIKEIKPTRTYTHTHTHLTVKINPNTERQYINYDNSIQAILE